MRTMKVLSSLSFLLSLLFVWGCSERIPSGFTVFNLKVENLVEPVGIDIAEPSFSWMIKSSQKNVLQKSWQIELSDDSGVVWATGKIDGGDQVNVIYQGKSLKENTTYTWKLKVWNNQGETAEAKSQFHVGLLTQESWKAKWIGANDISNRTPYLRKEFDLDKEVKSAFLYVTGLGYYESYLNGQKVGDRVLDPLPSQYQYRVYYSVFNVTEQISKGRNTIGLILGEAQAASSVLKPERFYNMARPYPGPFDAPRGIAQLMVTFADGSSEIFTTDESWKAGTGPISYNHFYGGENYDATIEDSGWDQPGFDDQSWEFAAKRPVDAILTATMVEPIRVVDILEPVTMTHPSDSVWLYDLGQLIGGWWRITVEGEAGTVVKVQGAETLNNQSMPKALGEEDVISTVYAHGLGGHYERDAYTLYTLNGKGTEVYEPRFFYSGFRYLQVTCNDPEKLKSVKVEGCTVHNNLEQLGSFECSDPVLTKLHQNTFWTVKAIFQGAPMSNSNSEKYGWTGDAHLFAEPTNMIFNAQNFWRKWLTDIRDAQLFYETGNVVNTIPNYRRDTGTTSATWGAAYPLIAWYNYCFYNDVKVLDDHYNGIKAWAEHLEKKYPKGLIKGVWADHVQPGMSIDGKMVQRPMSVESSELIASVYYYRTLILLKRMAEIGRNNGDVKRWTERAERVKSVINDKYFKEEKGYYEVPEAPEGFYNEQAANLIPLQYGLVPKGFENSVLEYVVNDIQKHENHLTTGIMGTKAMVDVLPENGFDELFYKVATQETYPGWGFWINQGATTHWQHWSGDPDHCHAMFGSISNFLIANIAGVRIPSLEEGTVGYKHIHFKPQILEEQDFAKASVPSNYGVISIQWKKNGRLLQVNLDIPAGTTARFTLPESYHEFADQSLNDKLQVDDKGLIYIELGSGKYHFDIN